MDAQDPKVLGCAMERCGAASRGVHQQAERCAAVKVSSKSIMRLQ